MIAPRQAAGPGNQTSHAHNFQEWILADATETQSTNHRQSTSHCTNDPSCQP